MSLLRRRECCLPMLLFTALYTLLFFLRPGTAAAGTHDSAITNPALNVQFFGTFHLSEGGSRGIELTDTGIYPASLTPPHTGPEEADTLASTDFLKELNDYLSGIYGGGTVQISDEVLFSVDWGRLGMVYETPTLFKASIYYYLSDPLGENSSGFEGEVSYAVGDSMRLGVTATGGLSKKPDTGSDWKGLAFLSYSFGSQQATQ